MKRSNNKQEAISLLKDKRDRRNRREFFEERYRMLMSSIPFSVLLVSKNLRVVEANKNFLEKARRIKANTEDMVLEQVLPVGLVEHMEMGKRVREVFQSMEAVKGERLTFRAPGVPLRTYYYSIIPLTYNGVTEEVLLLMDDVTERMRLSQEILQLERRLASVVESASDIIVSMDTEGRIVTWNSAAEKITGYGFDELKGRFFYELCVPESQTEIKNCFQDSGRLVELSQREYALVTKSNINIPVSWVFSTMKNEAEKIEGVVGIGRDLTEKRKLEVQILQSQKLAALGVMAGGIAHEIRNPLAVCSSAAQFLMEDDISPEFLKECVDKILIGVERSSFIIENLLRFARPSAPENMKPTDLVSVIRDTVTIIAHEAKLQKIKIVTNISSSPVYVNGNMSMLEQMLLNLIFNSLKAMTKGGILTINLEVAAEEAILTVTDTGCGIPKEHRDKIFDPFYSTEPVGKGSGLGLSLCYSIARQHAGTIEVDSVEGEGTSFYVKVPVLEKVRHRKMGNSV